MVKNYNAVPDHIQILIGLLVKIVSKGFMKTLQKIYWYH